VRVLVRDATKGAAITKEYSQVQIVNGGLDDTDIIAQEAKDADMVVRKLRRLSSIHSSRRAFTETPFLQT
jgi:hypothetical protein